MRPPPSRLRAFGRGYVLLLALVFLGIFLTVGAAYVNSIASAARNARYGVENTAALALAEAGVDKAITQLDLDGNYAGETDTALGSGVFSVVVSTVNATTKRLVATGAVPNATNPLAEKTVTTLVERGSTTLPFRYGVQAGAGGVSMGSGSLVSGSLFSNGPVSGSGTVTGDATVASGTPVTSLSGITVNGTAWADTLVSCVIGADAFYSGTASCAVGGTSYPVSAAAGVIAMPVSNAHVSNWETAAAGGGTTAGPHTVSGAETLGPQKIDGNLTVNGTLTLSGVVWVKGDVTFAANAALTVDAAVGSAGVALIADVPGTEATKGVISVASTTSISGNGSAGSYPMLFSTNTGSAAIAFDAVADSAMLVAPNGAVVLATDAAAAHVSADTVTLNPTTSVTYHNDLQSQRFVNGPGGTWAVVPHTYAISR